MGYTMSFEASVKVQRGQIAGLLRHNGRDVDREHGREVRHANQDIDAARTADNVTLVSDGGGSWKQCGDLREVEAALDARLATVKRPLRRDAVVLRPLVLQLDPDWYTAHPDEGERDAAASDMVAWAADTFGAENLVYISLHNDEANPHLHIGFTPVTPDGRLSQKDWFSSPAQLRKMHQDLRQHMTDAGYDVEMDNRKPGKHAKRMRVQEYKDFQDLRQEARKIDSQQGQLIRWAERLRDREKALQEREAALNRRQTALEAREAAFAAKADQIAAQATKAATEALEAVEAGKRQEAAAQAKARAEARAAAAATIQRAMGYAGSVQQPGQRTGPGYSL